jgi:hypothetical protein
MVDHKDYDFDSIDTIEEYFEVFGKDEEAIKHLLTLFVEQIFDLQDFISEMGSTSEDFIEWQRQKEDRQYH